MFLNPTSLPDFSLFQGVTKMVALESSVFRGSLLFRSMLCQELKWGWPHAKNFALSPVLLSLQSNALLITNIITRPNR